jgi:hypothetical protein
MPATARRPLANQGVPARVLAPARAAPHAAALPGPSGATDNHVETLSIKTAALHSLLRHGS